MSRAFGDLALNADNVAPQALMEAGPVTTPDAVLQFQEPTKGASFEAVRPLLQNHFSKLSLNRAGFLCKLTENVYGVEFLEFEVKDYDSGRSVFKV